MNPECSWVYESEMLVSATASEKLVTIERKLSYLCGTTEDMTLRVWRTWGESVGNKLCYL